ncbi:hypothetical protein [Marinoscillum sp.]|uniref:hypothetical protein n=1 Tax=Marinoscillum sp. TaxID=2024838 RepID=UPI003BACCC7E
MRQFFIIVLITCKLTSTAQVAFKVNLSEKHRQKVERTQDIHKKLKRYRKLIGKEERKARKAYADSLKNVTYDQMPYDSALIVAHLPDSSSREDSLAWALNALAQHHEYGELQASLQNLDSAQLAALAQKELTPKVEQLTKEYLPKDMQQTTDFQSMQAEQMGELPFDPTSNPADQLPFDPAASPAEKIEQLQEKVNPQDLAQLQQKLTKLKSKYISIPDLSNPDSGVKRNSLKGRPLKDRIYLGGNVAIQSTDPIILDSDIQLGYKVNKDLAFGAGFKWRESFHTPDSLTALSKDAHGYSLFVSHQLPKSFFAYGEYGTVCNRSLFGEREVKGSWQHEYLVGLGRQFKVNRFLDLTVLFLYDFNHRNNTTHPRPFVMRMGYRIQKLSLK